MTTTDEPVPVLRGLYAQIRAWGTVRWLGGPPRWVFGAASVATVLLLFYASGPPGGMFALALAAGVAWLALCVTFVVRLVVSLMNGAGRRRFLPRIALWLVFPVVLAAGPVATSAGVPERLALDMAKADMIAYAGDPSAPEPDRVGLYKVLRADRLPDNGARFHLADTGLLDATGWAYAPAGAPQSIVDDITYTPVGDGWYTFVRVMF